MEPQLSIRIVEATSVVTPAPGVNIAQALRDAGASRSRLLRRWKMKGAEGVSVDKRANVARITWFGQKA
jgi:hypothetical protein